jgi:hypothetical protein
MIRQHLACARTSYQGGSESSTAIRHNIFIAFGKKAGNQIGKKLGMVNGIRHRLSNMRKKIPEVSIFLFIFDKTVL